MLSARNCRDQLSRALTYWPVALPNRPVNSERFLSSTWLASHAILIAQSGKPSRRLPANFWRQQFSPSLPQHRPSKPLVFSKGVAMALGS